MVNDISARQLHDKATTGKTLTDSERARLHAWYEQQDADENALLVSSTASDAITVRGLRSEVAATSAQLLTVTQRIQSLIEENEAVRREIAALSQQLTQTTALQRA